MTVPSNTVSRQFDDVRANSIVLTNTTLVGNGENRGQASNSLLSIEAVAGSPENNVVGSVGDVRIVLNGTGGIWQKTTGNRTKTGWTQLSSANASVSYGNAVSISGNTNAAGSSTAAARSDHTHQLTTAAASTGQVPVWNGSAWAAVSPSAVQLTTATPSNGQVPVWNGSAWVATTLSTPAAGTTASTITPDASVAAGSSTNYARQDHVHAIAAAAAVSISGNANAEGTSTSFSRADHTHQLTSSAPSNGQVPQWNGSAWVPAAVATGTIPSAGTTSSTITPDATTAAGTSTNYARQDHVHGVVAATAVSISGNTNAEGTSTSFSRSDHTHQITTAAPSIGQVPTWTGSAWVAQTPAAAPSPATTVTTLTPDATAVPGTSALYARQDHIHAITAASAVAISSNASAEGSSTSFARADHTHQLTNATPISGQVPQWNGSAWAPSSLVGGNIASNYLDVGGLRFQFGSVGTGGDGTVTLPAPFADANYSVTAAVEGANATTVVDIMIESHTTTQFSYRKRSKTNGSNAVASATEGFRWIAIGRAP